MDFQKHTVAELKAMAKSSGYTGYSKLNKQQLVTLLNGKKLSFVDACSASPKREIADFAKAIGIVNASKKTRQQLCVEIQQVLEPSQTPSFVDECNDSFRKNVVEFAKAVGIDTTNKRKHQICVELDQMLEPTPIPSTTKRAPRRSVKRESIKDLSSSDLQKLRNLASRGNVSMLQQMFVRPDKIIANEILDSAAREGHESVMYLAKKWGAKSYDWALANAAEGGHESAMRLAKEWGATDYDLALEHAAEQGQNSTMRLAKEWGATDYDWALAVAAGGGHESTMRLLKKWGATDFDQALLLAKNRGQESAARLLREWGAIDSNW